MKHTQEPWSFVKICQGVVDIKHDHGTQMIERVGEVITEENARRIVACVNSCAGIPTEVLENIAGGMGPNWLEAKQQRDELLAALDMIATSCEIDTLTAAIDCAKNAIAKIEASK